MGLGSGPKCLVTTIYNTYHKLFNSITDSPILFPAVHSPLTYLDFSPRTPLRKGKPSSPADQMTSCYTSLRALTLPPPMEPEYWEGEKEGEQGRPIVCLPYHTARFQWCQPKQGFRLKGPLLMKSDLTTDIVLNLYTVFHLRISMYFTNITFLSVTTCL